MKFSIVGPDGEGRMSTDQVSCVYPIEILLTMEKDAGYQFIIDGKQVKASKVHQVISGIPASQVPNQTDKPTIKSANQHSNTNVSDSSESIESKPVVQAAAGTPPYNIKWTVCKRSKSYLDTKSHIKVLDNLDDAIALLCKKKDAAGSSYWAGGVVEDSSNQVVYVLSL